MEVLVDVQAREGSAPALDGGQRLTCDGPWRAAVAWSLDGSRLAVFPTEGSVVLVYSCETGEVVARLPARRGVGLQGWDGLLRWALDGAHLALIGSKTGPFTRWAVPQQAR
jgi:hypothetical protein